jgi:hypothetical protein
LRARPFPGSAGGARADLPRWFDLVAEAWGRARGRRRLSAAKVQRRAERANTFALEALEVIGSGAGFDLWPGHTRELRLALDTAGKILETSGARRPEVVEHDVSERMRAFLEAWYPDRRRHEPAPLPPAPADLLALLALEPAPADPPADPPRSAHGSPPRPSPPAQRVLPPHERDQSEANAVRLRRYDGEQRDPDVAWQRPELPGR